MPRAIQTFEVSLKAAIFRDGKLLLVQESDTGFWELPGGRIDVGEEWMAHADILAREIAEELGTSFHVTLHTGSVTWTRQRPTDGVFQFLVARLASYDHGAAQLSSEHTRLAWTTPDDWSTLVLPPQSGYANALVRIWALAAAASLCKEANSA